MRQQGPLDKRSMKESRWEAALQVVNRCAAHDWRQVLIFGIWLNFGE